MMQEFEASVKQQALDKLMFAIERACIDCYVELVRHINQLEAENKSLSIQLTEARLDHKRALTLVYGAIEQ